jgi:glutathione S-transferase
MKLYGTPGSPFVRKVRIVLEEKRIPHEYIIERPSGGVVPLLNPLAKIPVLETADGKPVYDSTVIVEYLEGLHPDPALLPRDFTQRIEVKRWEALGDGIAEATVAINHEYREPKEKQRATAWFEKQRRKIDGGLTLMEKELGSNDYCFGNRFSLADVAAGYALGYLDYALPEVEWRQSYPNLKRLDERLVKRKSFADTVQVKWNY